MNIMNNFTIKSHKDHNQPISSNKGDLFFPTLSSLESFVEGFEFSKKKNEDPATSDIIRENNDYTVVVDGKSIITKRTFSEALSFYVGLTINHSKNSDRIERFDQKNRRQLLAIPYPNNKIIYNIDFLPSALNNYFEYKILNNKKYVIEERHYFSYKKSLENSWYICFFIIETDEFELVLNLGERTPLYYFDKKQRVFYSFTSPMPVSFLERTNHDKFDQ